MVGFAILAVQAGLVEDEGFAEVVVVVVCLVIVCSVGVSILRDGRAGWERTGGVAVWN